MKAFLVNIAISVLLFYACSAPETIIKQRSIEIAVPAIKDTIPSIYKNISADEAKVIDSLFLTLRDSARFEGEKEVLLRNSQGKIKGSLKVGVKYFPADKKFSIDVPEQKVDSSFTDTTKTAIKDKIKISEKFGYVFIGLIAAFVGYLIIKMKRQ